MGKENGIRLRELRQESKLTAEQFAELFSVAETTQISYENGNRAIPLEYAISVCNKFGTTLDWIYGRSAHKNDTDIMTYIVLSLNKIMKVGYRDIKNDGYIYHEPVLWVDKTFAKYLQEIEELQRLRRLKEKESFSLLMSDVQKTYEKYFQQLFGKENYIPSESNFDKIEAV